MKLTDRTQVSAPLADASLVHLVQGGASWKATLLQLFTYLFSTKQTLNITYTGTPQLPIVFEMILSPVVVPAAAVSGAANYSATLLVSAMRIQVQEGMATTGNRLATLSFNDLQYANGVNINLMVALTSLAFPELLYCGGSGFTVTVMPGLVTLSTPKLIDSASNFNVGSCFLLTSIDAPELKHVQLNLNIQLNPLLTSLTMVKLVTVDGSCSLVVNCALLTTISVPLLKYVGLTFGPNNSGLTSSALATLSCPLLENVGANFIPSTFSALTTFNFPALVVVGSAVPVFGGSTNGGTFGGNFAPTTFAILTTLSTPALVIVYGNYAPSTMALLTTLSADVMTTVYGNFSPTTMASLVTFSFPALATIGGNFSPTTMASLTTVTLAGMISYGGTIAIPSASMANVASVTLGTIGTLKVITGATITLSGLKIPSANVNAILALLVSLDGTNGTTLWGAGKTLTINGGTNGAPSGQGIVDKATLVARGATVTTN